MKIWENAHHAAISWPEAKKGEQIILITTQQHATLSELTKFSIGITAINFPKKILLIDAIPVMATGKTDYVALTNWAISQTTTRIKQET